MRFSRKLKQEVESRELINPFPGEQIYGFVRNFHDPRLLVLKIVHKLQLYVDDIGKNMNLWRVSDYYAANELAGGNHHGTVTSKNVKAIALRAAPVTSPLKSLRSKMDFTCVGGIRSRWNVGNWHIWIEAARCIIRKVQGGVRREGDKVQRMMSPVKMNPLLVSYRLGDTS